MNIWFLEYRLKFFEEAVTYRWSWPGWLGMFLSSNLGLYLDGNQDTLLTILLLVMSVIGATYFVLAFMKSFRFRKLTLKSFIDNLDNENDDYWR